MINSGRRPIPLKTETIKISRISHPTPPDVPPRPVLSSSRMSRLILHCYRKQKPIGTKCPLHIDLTVDGAALQVAVDADMNFHGCGQINFTELARSVREPGLMSIFSDWHGIDADGLFEPVLVTQRGDFVHWVTNPEFYPQEYRFHRDQYGAAIHADMRQLLGLIPAASGHDIERYGQTLAMIKASANSLSEYAEKPF